MLPEEQLPGETSRTERGDAVRNVYKAERGRPAGDPIKNNAKTQWLLTIMPLVSSRC